MDKFFNRERFRTENEYAEYIDLYLIIIIAVVTYIGYGISFFFFAYSPFLIITQALSIFICVVAFIANQLKATRAASIIMLMLISTSINIWAYSVDVGGGMRWFIVLALCPLYFFSSFRPTDKFLFTVLIVFAFSLSVMISYYHEPLARMPSAHIFDIVSNCVIFFWIVGELILYKYVSSQQEKALKRIETILASIECGIAIIDEETHEILDINEAAARMYEDVKENIIGKKCHNLICPAQEGACPITDKNQTVDRSERVLVKADGTTIPIVKSVSKIFYKEKMVLLESFSDISELKEAEGKLRLLEVTEQANRAKSEFLSRMSHEMRTPMNAIIGMTKIAEGTDDVSRLKYCLSTIDVSSVHLLSIINDILDMSKIEAGKLEIDSAPLHIENILMKAYKLVAEPIEQKNLKLDITLTRDTTRQYTGDELRLSQIVANLMSNAVKFTHSGGAIGLTVEEVQKEADASILRFTVTDTGIGMTKEQIEKLFNAFEQADGSITRQFGGTGLGLAISKSIIEKMGGKIWAESELGKGSTFYFEVRLEHSSQQEGNAFLIEKIMRDKKLLVVDGDAKTRTYLRSIAGWYEADADEADTSEAMIAYIEQAEQEQEPYDVIFIAYEWPDTNGIELVEQLNRSVDRSKIVLMTSFSTWNKIEKGAGIAGTKHFVSKPLFPTTVLKSIGNVLGETNITADEKVKTTPDFSDITVLLVEDIAINREIFITLLADTKLTVDIAENGAEAVQKYKENPERYTMIVMDIQMPEMNGFEATQQIRELNVDKAKTIPIIAMSADAFQEDIDKCLACGMNDHLKKPIEMELVIEKILHYGKNR